MCVGGGGGGGDRVQSEGGWNIIFVITNNSVISY